MFFADAIFALILALLFGLLLSAAFRVRGPWEAPWALFLVLFLFIWAGGAWVAPVGPAVYDVYWLPFVLFGVVVMLLLAAGAPSAPRTRSEALAEARADEEAATVGLTAFFWFLIAVLAIAIVARYV